MSCLDSIAIFSSNWILDRNDGLTFDVAHLPLSIHTDELLRVGTLPRSKLTNSTFESFLYPFRALSDLDIKH
jgi:hypothetical protein